MNPRWAAGAAAIASVALLTAGTFHFGLHTDDYFMLRPHTWGELRRAWHGSWDWGQVWPPYYRPLTVWASQATFTLTGFSAPAIRTVVALELVAVAWLLGQFVMRELRSPVAGAFAAALITVQPAAVLSMGWYFQQNHRWAAAATVTAFLLWQRLRRTPSAAAWWPIHVAVLTGTLFKEDVLAVEPLLLLWQWMRARWIGDVPRPTVRMSMALAAGCGLFVLARRLLLGQLGGELEALRGPMDIPHHIGWSLYAGLIRFRDLHTGTSPAQWCASAATASLWIAGGVAAWRRRSPSALLMAQGATLALTSAIMASVAVPWYTRHHIIAMGGVLIAAGCLTAIVDRSWPGRRVIAGAAASALLIASLFASRGVLMSYGPCDPNTLDEDGNLSAWIGARPIPEFQWIRPWLDLKARLCDSGTYYDVDEAVRRGEIKIQ